MKKFTLRTIALMVMIILTSLIGVSQSFTAGNLVVYRVGDGVSTLAATGNAVFLDEYTTSGTLVQSIALPTTVSGLNKPLVSAGNSSSEGLMTLSVDGQYLILAGYASTIPYATSLPATASTVIPRVIGVVSANASINTTTALTDAASASNPRGACSTDGNALWMDGGAGGAHYTTLASTTSTQLSTTVTNLRGLNIFDGQLYTSDASGSAVRLGTIGTGTPTTSGQIITSLPGYPTTGGSPYGFFFADLDAGVPGVDVVYVADDGGTIIKYSLVAGTWVANGTIAVAAVRGITGSIAGTTVTLYVTSATTASPYTSNLITLTDASGYNATITGTPTTLATITASTTKAFRGVAFAPVSASIAAPTIQASAINFTSVSSTGMTVNWTNGDGAMRIVIINTSNSFTNPADGTDPTANTVYGGSGEQVVYNGSGSTVSVTGLTGSSTYWFRVYEYNGTGATTKYLTITATNNPNSQVTPAGAVAPIISSPTATTITNNTAVLGGNITDDGGSAITERGTVWNTSTGVTITDNKLAEGGTTTGIFTHTRSSLPAKTQIFYKAYATNTIGTTLTTESSFFTLADEPTTHVDGFAAAAGGLTSINLTWTTAAAGADGYLILQKTGPTAPTGAPSDATAYTVGNTVGDGTVVAIVISGATLSQTISSLISSTQYSYTIFPYAWDGSNAETYNYYTGGTVPSATATTNSPPTVTLPHYEPMDYTVGSALQTQPYWTALNTGDDLVIASGSLSYPGLAASTGNKVIFDGSGIDAAKLFTQQTSGTVYYSFLLNVTGLGSLGTTGGYFSGFTEGTGNIFGSTIWTRQDGTGYDIGLNPRTTAANTVWSASPTVIDTTVFIVVSYQMVAGSNNDSVKMWINPAASSFGGTEPTYTLTATNTITDLANVNRILIRQDNATNTPFIQMDELRIGLTWADVTPPGISVPVDTQVAGVVGDQVDTCYNASDSIIVAGGITTFTVEPGGSAIMIAGQDIQYMPGTMVMSGGYMHGYITTTGTYCGTFAPTIVSKTMDAAEVAPEMEAGAFFKIYPNPTNDKIYLELDPAFRDTKTVVRIFGMVGDLIQQKEVMGNDHYEFSLGGKTPGIYFIRVMAGDRIDTKKIIKN